MVRVLDVAKKGLGFALVLTAMASCAFAIGNPDTPEIDAGSAASAITLLTAGMLMLKEKFARK